jgi:dihydrodipicolinate synthase/N-acetylneuraminate lyase
VSDHSLELLRSYLALGIPVFTGSEALIPAALEGGAAGAVSGLASAFPEAVSELLHAPADEAAARVDRLNRAVDTTAFIAALKHALVLRGVPVGRTVRPPQRAANGAERQAVEAALADELRLVSGG